MDLIVSRLELGRVEWIKVAAAGLVGALSPLVLVGVASIEGVSGFGALICPSGGLECVIPFGAVALAVTEALAWVALVLMRVRPAWAVALTGSGLTLAIGWVTMQLIFAPAFRLAPLLTGAGFAVGALLTMRTTDLLPRAVVAATMLAVYPVAVVTTPQQTELDHRDELERVHVPLVVADVPGYRLGRVSTYGMSGMTYRLLPDGSPDPATPYERRRPGEIEVSVTTMPARFTLPADCGDAASASSAAQPCQALDARTWRRQTDGEVTYIAHDDTILITATMDADDSSDALVRQLVATGRPRSASDLAQHIP
ncbi:hypothetical protein J5X84_07225 [Streptosporangiaceae bacterium NEAU-GS5]|nr:hypothetical protein [Streptosporangiaceae bacterium NEAU-GS5]